MNTGNISHFANLFLEYQAEELEMLKEFNRRYEEAYKKYWNACNLPRKAKKRMRREALSKEVD